MLSRDPGCSAFLKRRFHQPVGLTELYGLGVGHLGGRVQVVGLPDVPSGRIGLLLLSEAESLDAQALNRRINDDWHEVVGDLSELGAEGLVPARCGELEAVVSLVIGVKSRPLRPAIMQAFLKSVAPLFGRVFGHEGRSFPRKWSSSCPGLRLRRLRWHLPLLPS